MQLTLSLFLMICIVTSLGVVVPLCEDLCGLMSPRTVCALGTAPIMLVLCIW